MKKVEILAPAKINLFLKILSIRSDGFHNIETVFEKVSLYDKLSIQEACHKHIVLKSSSKEIPLNDKNTVYKAINLIKQQFKINNGVEVYIDKKIPVEAGLGGGSSDAVAAIKGLNRLWNLGMSKKDMLEISDSIGSDVSLFVFDHPFLLGTERGNVIKEISHSDKLKLWHILIMPSFGISSALAYSLFDRHFVDKESEENCQKLKLTIPNYNANIITHALRENDVSLLNYYSYNSFGSVIIKEFKKLARIKNDLEGLLSDFIHISGSGPTLFLTFSKRKEALSALSKLEKSPEISKCRSFLVHTCKN